MPRKPATVLGCGLDPKSVFLSLRQTDPPQWFVRFQRLQSTLSFACASTAPFNCEFGSQSETMKEDSLSLRERDGNACDARRIEGEIQSMANNGKRFGRDINARDFDRQNGLGAQLFPFGHRSETSCQIDRYQMILECAMRTHCHCFNRGKSEVTESNRRQRGGQEMREQVVGEQWLTYASETI